jgi:RNA polymerase sigma-70 factor (ECF subfamily)
MADLPDNTRTKFLVLRCQVGDKEAFNELLASVESRLFAYVRRLTGDTDSAKDVLQDVFLIIYRKIGWLNDPNLFLQWAYRIASREAFRYIKRERKYRHEELVDLGEAVSSAQPAFDAEMLIRLPQILEQVSPASRALIVLHYLEGFTLAETAEILDIAPGTAKSRLAYGLTVMRKHFGVANEGAADLV